MLKYARCRLQAVCDINEEAAAHNARVFGAQAVYTDIDTMLNQEDIDGVCVVGPHDMHFELGKKVLERGLPLFVEKPPAPDLASTLEMAALARANETFFMTGFMKRHGLAYVKARELINAGVFLPSVGFFKYAHWHTTPENLPGMLMYMSIHIIDLALSFFGGVAEVMTCRSVVNNTLSLGVTLRFTSGRWAQLMLDGSQPRIQERVEISGQVDGQNALIVIDNLQHLELHRQQHNGIDLLAPTMQDIEPHFELSDIQVWRPDYALPNMQQNSPFIQGFAGEIREFVDAVIEDRDPYPSMDDAINAMQVVDAILTVPDGIVTLEPLTMG